MSIALGVLRTDVFDTKLEGQVEHAIIKTALLNDMMEVKLLARPECEDDASYLQLVPYITLQCKDTGKIFMHQRESGEVDDRLNGYWAVGFGNHIQKTPCQHGLLKLIAESVRNDLSVEIGLPDNNETYRCLLDKLQTGNFGLYYNWSKMVHEVHLGVMMTYKVDRSLLRTTGGGIISRGDWYDVDYIVENSKAGLIKLEKWSEFVLNAIVSHMYR